MSISNYKSSTFFNFKIENKIIKKLEDKSDEEILNDINNGKNALANKIKECLILDINNKKGFFISVDSYEYTDRLLYVLKQLLSLQGINFKEDIVHGVNYKVIMNISYVKYGTEENKN